MTNIPDNEAQGTRSTCSSFFQNISNQFTKLAQLFFQVDKLAQLFFAVKTSVEKLFGSFFASKTPPAEANPETVDRVAQERFGNEPPADASVLQPEADLASVQEPDYPVVMDDRAPEEILEAALEDDSEPVLSAFEQVRAELDPSFKVTCRSPIVKIESMDYQKTPEISPTARQETTGLQRILGNKFSFFGMSFFHNLKEIESKTFLAKIGGLPFLVQAKTHSDKKQNQMENKGDHLTLHVYQRSLTFYPLQK